MINKLKSYFKNKKKAYLVTPVVASSAYRIMATSKKSAMKKFSKNAKHYYQIEEE